MIEYTGETHGCRRHKLRGFRRIHMAGSCLRSCMGTPLECIALDEGPVSNAYEALQG
ncbi:hypothetical protein [Stutzerimonas stutzeri]|uniref:hypothetical protein n=1 Tax=Stutzerimonas stutzeri TaxID=316 RepID=UPI0004B257F7|nr:hypothetical protein [Stutzerimonas stutzeri]MCQ4327899.1 hypothetical protein [Stutzerimonas stutzeri]